MHFDSNITEGCSQKVQMISYHLYRQRLGAKCIIRHFLDHCRIYCCIYTYMRYQGPLLPTRINLNPSIGDEITYSFPNFNGWTVEFWEWISDFILHFTLYDSCNYLSMLGLKLTYVSKRSHWSHGMQSERCSCW